MTRHTRKDPSQDLTGANAVMGVHDKLADKAVAKGNTATDFHAAAGRHANATWVWLIASGVVWYLTDWKWALIPAAIGAFTAFSSVSATMVASRLERTEPATKSANGTDFTAVVQAYGRLLETDAPVDGTVADTNKLPYPKQKVKEALLAALLTTPDERMREQLKVGYIYLADWQDGVGDANRGFDPSTLDRSKDTKSLSAQVSSAVADAQHWTDAADREREALKKELEELGLWGGAR